MNSSRILTCRTALLLLVFLLVATQSAHCSTTAPATKPKVVYTFDARPLNNLDLSRSTNAERLWDTMHLLSAVQGLANREEPVLYLFYCREFGVDTDQFWFDWLREEDGWLKGIKVQQLTNFEEVIQTFRHVFRGLVVYDPAVPATADVASTAAGCADLLPVRYDPTAGSIYDLLARQLRIPVELGLVKPDGKSLFTGSGKIPGLGIPSSGSAKVDAYLWAVQEFIKSGRCAPGVAAYYIDSFWLKHPRRAGPEMHTLSNHDYFVSRRAFFFDLSCWGDEVPTDDQDQELGLDRRAFMEVMAALYQRSPGRMIRVGGFTPWPYKYTSHASPPGKHEGVPTEWEFGRLISQYNGFMEADAAGLAGMANASFYRHYPCQNYKQPNRRPDRKDWLARGYIDAQGKVANKFFLGHYVGDYDAPSWLYKAVPKFFRDPKRGQVPLGWAFDPNLAERAPQVFGYVYRNAGTNDYFVAGDSGAGYLNPRGLTHRPDSGLPAGLSAWGDFCRQYFARFDMDITGFILDGASGASGDREFAEYATFSPFGAGTHFEKGPAVHQGMPTCPERDLPDDVQRAAAVIAQAGHGRGNRPGFFWARSILKPPSWYAELSRILKEKYPAAAVETVDPYTFFGLIKLAYENTTSASTRN